MKRRFPLQRYVPAPIDRTDEWWSKALRLIGGEVGDVTPYLEIMRGKMRASPQDQAMVETLIVRFRVPYVRYGKNTYDYQFVRACFERLLAAVEKFGQGSELDGLLRKAGVRKCALQMIDSGKVHGRGVSNSGPQPVIEKLVA